MAQFDEALYHDTKQNLMAAAKGDDELVWLVEDQLKDMKASGFFDLVRKNNFRRYDEDDHFDRNIL